MGLAELAGGDVTLDQLVEAWRERPIAELGELIVAIARQRPVGIETDRTSIGAAQAQWLAIARAPSTLERGWLLDQLVASRGAHSLERLRRLAELPSDPRDVPALLGIATAMPHTSRQHRPFWTLLLRVLQQRRDPRSTLAVVSLAQRSATTEFEAYLAAKLRGLAARPARDWPIASAPELAAIAAIGRRFDLAHAATAARTIDDFLAEVWAQPRDDGPREVFADWLLERGDPRGELITLQIARLRGACDLRRERTLLGAHAREWMGPLEPAISNRFTFDRGFLATCKVTWRRLVSTPALMTHPAWSTVREYQLDPEGERPCDRWLDHMIALGAKRG